MIASFINVTSINGLNINVLITKQINIVIPKYILTKKSNIFILFCFIVSITKIAIKNETTKFFGGFFTK